MTHADLVARYYKEAVADAPRVIRRVAERQPLMYLAWLESARRGHAPCDKPDCPMCNPIRDLTIPLPEEVNST